MKDRAKQILESLLDQVGMDQYEVEIIDMNQDEWQLNIGDLTDRDTALLIGRQGENLQALQYLTRILLRAAENLIEREERNVFVDVMNYRQRQVEQLVVLARRKAEEARYEGNEIVLRPMSGFERRIVHMTLREEEGIETESIGEEPNRSVVIRPRIGQIEI